jgi:hypothetical protein
MWPFKQKLEAPAAEGPKPVPAPVIRRDWVGLPPIQRFVGAHPLTAPSDRFRDDLVTHQDPSVSSDTMGHQVSAEAPPGLVLALARPTTRSDGPAMIPRPRVQRSVASAVAESGEWDGDEAASESTRPTPLPASAHTVAARELPVVAPEPAVQRLVSLSPDEDPTPLPPVAQRSRAVPTPLTIPSSGDEASEAPSAPLQRLTLGQSRRMGLGAPIKRVPDRSVQRAATELPLPPLSQTEEVDASPVAREPIDASPVGQVPDRSVQRAAIDRPLATLPQKANESMDASLVGRAPDRSAQRAAAELPLAALPQRERESVDADEPRLDLPLSRSPLPQRGREIMAVPSVHFSAESSPEPESDASMTEPPAVQRVVQGDGSTPSSSGSAQTLTVANPPKASTPLLSVSRLALVTESPARVSRFSLLPPDMAAMAPLTGARPLRPTSTLQRDASTAAPIQSLDAPTLTLPPRGGENQPQPDGEGTEAPGMSFLQRQAEDAPGPMELPALTPPQNAKETGRLPLAPSRGISVQASRDDTPLPDPPPQGGREILQGAWYEAPVAVSRVSAGAASSESSTASSGPHQASETEMDELARKLYDRLRTRLKTELLVDRERAGFLTDLR